MDPRERAEAALARARARGSYVVTPDTAISPMDAKSTLQIPRSVILAAAGLEDDDPDATMVVPAPLAGALGGDDRTRSMPSPAGPPSSADHDSYGYESYEDDNPFTHSPRTQPLHLQQPGPRPAPEPVHEEQDGIIPTTTTVTRRTLAQRLDGE